MIKYFQYDKNNAVVSYSDGLIESSVLKQVEINVSDSDFTKIKEGYKASINKDKLVLEKSEVLIEKEKKDSIIQEINDAQNIEDLKVILLKMI